MFKVFANFRSSESDPLFIYLRDRYKDKPFTFWYDKFPDSLDQLQINPYNFLFIHEPDEFFGMARHATSQYSNYVSIFSWDQNLLNLCENGIKFTYNGRTLDLEYLEQISIKEKTFQVSFLCGTKNLVEGHKLRHKIHKLESQIQIPKKWYYVLEDYDHSTNTRPGYQDYSKDLSHIPEGVDIIGYGRRTLFNDSMFNVVIENVNHLNWYNKIGDNFLSKTLPLYWGCPNISEFGYDERGIIRFTNEEELLQIINNLTPELYYQMKPYIDYNYEIAKLDELTNNMSNFFDNFIELNNL
jgi:hypothetical protein